MIQNEKRFDGLAISEFQNRSHVLEIDKETVIIHQSFSSAGPHCDVVKFTFDMKLPVRFRLDVLLPENIVNACVALNSQILIGYYSTVFPADCELPAPGTCDNGKNPGHEKFSTLAPGKFQSINFKWFNTDVLKLYLFH